MFICPLSHLKVSAIADGEGLLQYKLYYFQMAQVNLEIVLHSPDEVLSLRLDGAEAFFTDLVQN